VVRTLSLASKIPTEVFGSSVPNFGRFPVAISQGYSNHSRNNFILRGPLWTLYFC